MPLDAALSRDQEIARSLPRAWPAFFQRFGRLTEVQRAVIPEALRGEDLLVCSATASGKTEAACAPLVERFLDRRYPWRILYVSPTRALVNDLHKRLEGPLRELGLGVRRRTGEYKETWFRDTRVVLTTPESLDSLLCRGRTENGHLLDSIVAVVLDEIHLVHGTPRGEQLRFLLHRLRQLRRFAKQKGWAVTDEIQVLALSATVPDPDEVRGCFLAAGEVVDIPGGREIVSVTVEGAGYCTEQVLVAYLAAQSQPEKILVFCNARKRVDDLTSELRPRLEALGCTVAAHHGSLSKPVREQTEALLQKGERVVAFATSTLEIGVDIGDIDLVVLDGPAPDIPALLQRIGRGNRRAQITRVLACGDSAADALIHGAMLEAARQGSLGFLERGPQRAVIRQQLASYIFQAPRRSRSRAKLLDLMEETGLREPGRSVLEHLLAERELLEDREGVRLGDQWADATRRGEIHSTIEGGAGAAIIDYTSGRPIAGDVEFRGGRGMRVGGQLLNVRRWDQWKIEVSQVANREMADGKWRYSSRPWMEGAGQPQAVRWFLGIPDGVWPSILHDGRTFVFHFGGGRRHAVLDLIRRAADRSLSGLKTNAWFLSLPGDVGEAPAPLAAAGPGTLRVQIHQHLDALERTLGRPLANRRLPVDVRVEEVEGWLAVEDEVEEIKRAQWRRTGDRETEAALRLLARAIG